MLDGSFKFSDTLFSIHLIIFVGKFKVSFTNRSVNIGVEVVYLRNI